MLTARSSWLLSAVGFWLAAAPLARWVWGTAVAPPSCASDGAATGPALPIQLAPAHSPAGQALREARIEWIRAREVAARELERSPETGAAGVIWHVTDARRQSFMAADRSGALGRALRAARRASGLARTPAERWHAAELLARLECDAGDHAAELRYARQLIALQPRQRASWETLKHAAVCNADLSLTRQADEQLEELPPGSGFNDTTVPAR